MSRAATTARRCRRTSRRRRIRVAGAYIDYYIKPGTRGPVTLEVLDASGAVLHTFSTDPAVAAASAPAAGGRGGGRGGAPRHSEHDGALAAGSGRVQRKRGNASGDVDSGRGGRRWRAWTRTWRWRSSPHGDIHRATHSERPEPVANVQREGRTGTIARRQVISQERPADNLAMSDCSSRNVRWDLFCARVSCGKNFLLRKRIFDML